MTKEEFKEKLHIHQFGYTHTYSDGRELWTKQINDDKNWPDELGVLIGDNESVEILFAKECVVMCCGNLIDRTTYDNFDEYISKHYPK